jgi:hypothetical protein
VARFLSCLRVKAHSENACVLIIHHPPKSNNKAHRGASALFNNVAVTYLFVRERDDDDTAKDNTRVIRQKSSQGPTHKPYELQFHVEPLYEDEGAIKPNKMRSGLTVSFHPPLSTKTDKSTPKVEKLAADEAKTFKEKSLDDRIMFILDDDEPKSVQQLAKEANIKDSKVKVTENTVRSALKRLLGNEEKDVGLPTYQPARPTRIRKIKPAFSGKDPTLFYTKI